MKTNNKGMVLVTVLMITIILSLMVVGLMPLVTSATRIPQTDLERQQLLFAAEGGVRALYSNLSRLPNIAAVMNANSKNAIGNNQTITINGASVVLNAVLIAGTPSVWNLTSTATMNGKTCVVKLFNISTSTVLENSLAFSSRMLGTSAWTGKLTKDANGKIVRDPSTDHFRGKTYFGGRFSVLGTPWFHGNCTYAQVTAQQYSSNIKGSDSWYKNTSQDGGSKYIKGIYDQGEDGTYSGIYGDVWSYAGGYNSNLAMKDRYSQMFDQGSYNISDTPISFDKSIYSWAELVTNTGKELTVVEKTVNSDVTITFTVSEDGATKRATLSTDPSNPIDLTACNVLKIKNSNGRDVKVSGVIDSDITLAVEKGTVKIAGDIYYKGFESYKDLTQGDILAESNNKVEAMRNSLSNATDKGIFGLINYGGHILIDRDSNKDFATGSGSANADKALLMMGAYYTPDGQFGSKTTSDNQIGNGEIGSYIPKGVLQVVNIGSIIAAQKAYYKTGGVGMASHLNSDLRFEKGKKPKGFPASKKEYTTTVGTQVTTYELFKFSESNMLWSVEWL